MTKPALPSTPLTPTRRDLLAALAFASSWPRLARANDLATASRSQSASGDDLVWLDVTTISARVAARTLSAIDLAEAYLRRIERLNGSLTAYVTVTGDRAREDARRVDRSLRERKGTSRIAGVPIAHKDLFETAGIRTTAGSRLYEMHVPTEDATLVARLATSGTVLLGKSNTHELGGGVTTINPFFGTTRNPWDRARIAGGSSGGSAAAVAGGLAAAATGSDTGGSVRIPAAFCGCVGFKPTFGRVSTAGLLGAAPTFDHSGLLTRTVADAMLIYAEIIGYDVRDPSTAPAASDIRTTPQTSRAPLRIGGARNYFFDGLQPDVARALESAIDVFRNDGHDVRDVSFPIDGDTMARVFDPIVVSEIHQHLAEHWQKRPDAFSASFAGFFKAPLPTALELVAAERALRVYQSAVRRLFENVDVVVTPTLPITAPPIDGPIDGALILRNTWPFNAARTPAISLPCGVDAQGLPIGLQLVAAPFAEATLFRAAAEYQRLTDWHRRHPA
jgi:aspartyl-tRNA(Asn)/glutamyl-tRNA(Gln) amidotransferase subunit A